MIVQFWNCVDGLTCTSLSSFSIESFKQEDIDRWNPLMTLLPARTGEQHYFAMLLYRKHNGCDSKSLPFITLTDLPCTKVSVSRIFCKYTY